MGDTFVLDGDGGLGVVIDGDSSLLLYAAECSDDELILDGEVSLDMVKDGDGALMLEGAAEFGIVIEAGSAEYPNYTGATTVTPGDQAVVLATADTIVHDDIVVAPIPSNYGLITWNGNTLTVS